MANESQVSGKKAPFRDEIAQRAALPRPLLRDLASRDISFFDQEWYEAQRGHRFDTRAEAIRDAASKLKDSRFSPHPLFDYEWFRETLHRRNPSAEPSYALLFVPGRPVANPHPLADLDTIARLYPESMQDPNGVFGWLLTYLGVDEGIQIPGSPNGAARPYWSAFRSAVLEQAKNWRKDFEKLRHLKSVTMSRSFDSSESDAYIAAMEAEPEGAKESADNNLVSVIVHGHDTAEDLLAALASLNEQANVRLDVVVVDQTPGGTQVPTEGAGDFLTIRRLDARGHDAASALNWSIRAAQGRYLAFLIPGYSWHPRFLGTMSTSLMNRSAKHGFSIIQDRTSSGEQDRYFLRFDASSILSGGTLSLSNWMVEKRLLSEHLFESAYGDACGLQVAWQIANQVEPYHVPFIGVSSPISQTGRLARVPSRVLDVWRETIRKRTLVDWGKQREGQRPRGVSAIVVWRDEPALELSKTVRSLSTEISGVSEIVVVTAKTERSGYFTLQAERSMATVPIKFRVVPAASSTLLANVGFAESAYDRVLFLRAGTEFESGQLHELSEKLTPDVAAVQPALVDQDGVVISAGSHYVSGAKQERLPFVFLEGHHSDDLKSVRSTMSTVGASLTAMMVWSDSFSQLEGFAAELPERWFEIDYSLRAMRYQKQVSVVAMAVQVRARQLRPSAQTSFWSQYSTEYLMAQRAESLTRDEDIWCDTPYALVGTRYDLDARELTERWIPHPILRRTTQSEDRTNAPLAIAVKHCAPGGAHGERWGDTFFARQLAGAMRYLGHEVYVDNKGSALRPSAYLDHLNIVVRGRYHIPALPGATNVLWIISHPELVRPEELVGFDLVYAASESWASWASQKFGVEVRSLLQATDTNHFQRNLTSDTRSADVLVVGNRRWEYERTSAKGLTLLGTGVSRGIYGEGWASEPALRSLVLGDYLDNEELPRAYSAAKVVLNDHHPSMRQSGFINNRIFDALAVGTQVISDTVAGGREIFGKSVKWYDSIDQIPHLVREAVDGEWSESERTDVIKWVRDNHSFESRARKILDDLRMLSASAATAGAAAGVRSARR